MTEEPGRTQQTNSTIRAPGTGRRVPLGDAGLVTFTVIGGEAGGTLDTY